MNVPLFLVFAPVMERIKGGVINKIKGEINIERVLGRNF